jgi:adenylate kinase family enzyme
MMVRGLGEYFLPFFLALMEACWFNGILIGLAGLDFLQSPTALLPFWGPPLLLCVALWLFRRALLKETESGKSQEEDEKSPLALPGLRLLFGVLALLALFFVWFHVYASTNVLFDPAWLLAVVGDLLTLSTHFYQALFILVITIYFCWRGMKLAQTTVEPGHVVRQLWVGMLILLLVILMRAGKSSIGASTDDTVLVLLIPVFLYISLSTHALARITFVRREHPFGLEGSVATQERAMLSVIAGVGAVLLVLTILGGAFFSTAFFSSLQPVWQALATAYDWLVQGFSQLVLWITTPFFWLASWWFSHFPARLPNVRQPGSKAKNPGHPPAPASIPPGIELAAKILLPLLIVLILVLLVRLALRHRKRLRIALNLKGGDIHESVWSWRLFWGQVSAFWTSLLARLFPRHAARVETEKNFSEEAHLSPEARSMREIYRTLLKRAATRGHARKRDETPHEFRQRLNAHEPQNEPQLGLLTEAYALTRYGGITPDEQELTTVRRFWKELEAKWEAR